MIRLWLLPQGRESRILTGAQLAALDVHPLRCIYLGRFPAPDDPAAIAMARERKAASPESILAHNVRIACDRQQTRRWRLSEQEIDLLRAGHTLRIRDRIGFFIIGYRKF